MAGVIRGAGEPVAPGEPRIWDDATTTEAFPGATAPLVFTLAAGIHGRVCREYARSLGVPADQLAQTDAWTPYLLGSFHGRVYLDLLHWYRLAAIAPGQRLNRRGLEAVLGAADPLLDEIAETLRPFTFESGARRVRSRARTTAAFVHRALRTESMMREFRTEFGRVCDRYEATDYRHGEHAYAEYRRLDRELVLLWGPVTVLDALALILTGAVVALTEAYLPEAPASFRYVALRPPADIGSPGASETPAVGEPVVTGEDPDAYLDRMLSGPRRWLYDLVRVRAARCAAHRDTIRSSRTRAAGLAEAMIRVMADDLAGRAILRESADIRYLTAGELRDCYDRVPIPDLQARIAARKAAHAAGELSAPVRFSTEGPDFSDGELAEQGWTPRARIAAAHDGEVLTGTASAAGVAEGAAVVVDRSGDPAPGVLVTESADPHWVAALPSASALVIEHGGPLTAVATVARALGVPTVVRVPGCTAKLRTGMRLRVDGSAGTVTVLSGVGRR
ncbi:PEP-utilizing enzyme [Nocardia rhamnosiphila]|uniref:PEP-utilizing enzyme n=1 Tax=Nocardia rhamnosiphila TaxID=426716 RepID=UPI00068AC4B1|nr:PEP-utilizing enzyme [Nocardia rhamnosiphila]